MNGYRVLEVMENLQTGELYLEMPMDYTNSRLGDCTIYTEDIKSILTHEQFSSMQYIVKED